MNSRIKMATWTSHDEIQLTALEKKLNEVKATIEEEAGARYSARLVSCMWSDLRPDADRLHLQFIAIFQLETHV